MQAGERSAAFALNGEQEAGGESEVMWRCPPQLWLKSEVGLEDGMWTHRRHFLLSTPHSHGLYSHVPHIQSTFSLSL